MIEKELPENWVLSNLGELSVLIRGVSYKKTNASQVKSEEFNTLILRGGNIQNGFIVNGKDEVYVNNKLVKENQFIKKSDVVIVGSTGSKKLIGKAGIALKNYHNTAFGAFLMLARANKKINQKYFANFFLSKFYRDSIRELAGGVNINNIRKEYITQMQFPLPPLAEQDRIVAKVDVLMAQIATMQKSLEHIPQLLKDFRQQVLTQAVTGKLTEEWRKGKELEPVILKNESMPVELSVFSYSENLKGWKITALGNYASVARGKFSARPRNDPKYFNGSYPFSQIGDLPREGGYYEKYSNTLNENGKKVSKSFPRNTVMIAIVGATIGNTGLNKIEMYFPDSMIGINSTNEISNQYIEYHLRLSKHRFREIAKASGGQPNIKIPTIKTLEIAIPSQREQKEIVRRVESLFAKADKIEERYKALKTKIDMLPQAILHKAFKGELVEQLPTDGDAKDLLREIEGLKMVKAK
ncbi:restriction endonuclease subunit S [Zobellia galactanivorans]|uniref:Type I restriction enzyme ZgaDI, S subunit n=1 Tax=Zobellia galactanivorans (strain DSM 12802 / CCUG 47099 / CIP 106680 / NCIMB 13871 / Dsij) TaxID=63186 RepID=G0L6C5_ZOBGA|nr:restriction endonuclease subunit S [Zobellia galactanivorans]CAZ96846.1 Type I restriction enzyme ZgaDI, S subunit [Zobellia galactanivorans]